MFKVFVGFETFIKTGSPVTDGMTSEVCWLLTMCNTISAHQHFSLVSD